MTPQEQIEQLELLCAKRQVIIERFERTINLLREENEQLRARLYPRVSVSAVHTIP